MDSTQTSTPAATDGTHVPCKHCKGSGRLRHRPCLHCDATGRRRRQPDEPAWDFYLDGPALPEAPSAVTTPPERSIDAEQEDRVDRVLKRRDRRDRAGSYRHLEWVLERLRDEEPELSRRLSLVYDHGLVELPDELEARAVLWVALAMPRTIRIPRWAYAEELERTKSQARRLRRDGMSIGAIAERLALRWRDVERIFGDVQPA